MSLHMRVDDSSPLITYEGSWDSFGPSSSASSSYLHHTFTSTWTQDASAHFKFNGSSVSLFGGRRNDYGNFTVTLDDQTTVHSAYSPEALQNSSLLFSAKGIGQKYHTLTVTNVGRTNSEGFDIDYITWTSDIANGSSSTTNSSILSNVNPSPVIFNASMPAFSWNGHWLKTETGGRSTSAIGACVNLTFEVRQAISLIGPIGSNYTSNYTVALDGLSPRRFCEANRINRTALLYHADNLGPGNHTITIINGVDATDATCTTGVGSLHDRQTTNSQSLFGIDHARVWNVTDDIITPPSNSPSPTSSPGPQHSAGSKNLSTGAIVGISLGSLALISLILLVLLLNKRNKTLWARLQKGYMVQSQSGPPSPSIRPDTTTFSSASSKRSKALIQNGDVDPYPLLMGEAGTNPTQVSTHRRDPDGSGVYTPYRGFGKSRSKKSRVDLEKVDSLTGSGEDDDQPSSVPKRPEPLMMPVKFGTNKDIGQETPSRSATLMTASTLVAEDGYDDTTDGMNTAVSNKPFPKLSSHGVHNPSTPTTLTASTVSANSPLVFHLPQRKSQTSSTPAGSRNRRSSRMSYSSHFSQNRWTRSPSPSQTHLLHFDPEVHSDYEDYDDDDDMGADFYAQDARGMLRVRSPAMSLARSQSDAQTPILGHLEDGDDESSFSRVQIPSWIVRNGSSLSFPNSFSAGVIRADPVVAPSPTQAVPPNREGSKDTLPTYTSRVPTLDLPPPFPSPPAAAHHHHDIAS